MLRHEPSPPSTSRGHGPSSENVVAHHLDEKSRVNLGAYYTDDAYVDIAWRLAEPYLKPDTIVLDSSCGYGNFFRHDKHYHQVGNDVDGAAIETAKQKSWVTYHNINSLYQVKRSQFGINSSDHLCVIGNPPYNDVTSQVRRNVKKPGLLIDDDIATRDLGMSFLKSYQKLQADIVCVLHPLSYLIKPANFRLLGNFTREYFLANGVIISSGTFPHASNVTHFPILIALYIRSLIGTEYEHVRQFQFEVADQPSFKLGAYDTIANYVRKYPQPANQSKSDDLFFWPLRDLNALRRNQTFVKRYSPNVIVVDRSRLEYYVYVDVIKQFATHIPYYFGNCDIPIDDDLFQASKGHFIDHAIARHPHLQRYFFNSPTDNKHVEVASVNIREYLRTLLGDHYRV